MTVREGFSRFSPFWRVGALWALAETFVVGALLLAGLVLIGDAVPSNVITQGIFFLSPSCALLCALRLRRPGRRRWWILREGGVAIGLGLLLGLGLPLLMLLVGGWHVLARTVAGGLGMTLVLSVSGVAFVVFRAGVWLWWSWDRLRRRRLIWSLVHAHLVLVVVLMTLLGLLGAVQVVFSGDVVAGRFESEDLAAVVAARITHTIFPFVGVMALFTVVALVVVLPPSVILSYIVSRRTTRRLEALAAAARALRGGDLSARVAVVGEDEVAQLQSDFNAMAADLERATGEIQAERDKVAALLRSRRELTAAVSHELRTPVATVRGYVESALSSDDSGLPQGLRRDLEVMGGEIERLQGLIDDLFALARAEAGGLALDLRPVDVAAVVQRQVEAMAPLAWQAGRVEVVADVLSGLPSALADEGRLTQILANLLHNGIRHTPPGGIVAVVAAAEEESIRIEVRDTGEGIPPGDLPHIWERFYRGEGSRADGRGAGLGLALVRELTEAMGGTVAVESVVGEGSCFTLMLPRGET